MKRIMLSLCIASLLVAASPTWSKEANHSAQASTVSVPNPAASLESMAQSFRANDLLGLTQSAIPPASYNLLRQGYELARLQPVSEEDRVEFDRALGKFIAADAVDQWMIEIEPKLEQARPQVPAAMLMGMGALQMAVLSEDSKLSVEEREMLKNALPGLQQWASSRDFLDSAILRQALTLVADAIRGSGVRNLDDAKQLSFEQALGQAEQVLASTKQALRLYGLDLDAIVDTLKVDVVSVEGNQAIVRATITAFNAPISREHQLVLLNGRWYPKDAAKHFSVDIEQHAAR